MPLTQAKNQEVAWYESNIRNALIAYPGIRVNVEVTIDPILHHREDRRSIDGDPIVVTKRVNEEKSKTIRSRPKTKQTSFLTAGVNGTAAVEAWPNGESNRRFEETELMTSGTFESTERAGLTVKQVSVSIGIPERCVDYFFEQELASLSETSPDSTLSYADQKARKAQIGRELAEAVKSKIVPLLPPGGLSQDLVSVTIDPYIPLSDLPTAPSPFSVPRWFWQHWKTLALIGFGIAALMILRIPTHSDSPQETTNAFPSLSSSPADEDCITLPTTAMPTTAMDRHLTPSLDTAASSFEDRQDDQLMKQLDRWCRENPDATAASIRQWLDRAG